MELTARLAEPAVDFVSGKHRQIVESVSPWNC